MHHDDALRNLATRQHNLIGRHQALALGVDSTQWRRLRDGPLWLPVTARVLRLRGGAPSRGEVVMAALLDDGGRVCASHGTAAWWWGIPGFSARPVHLARTSRTSASTKLGQVHLVRRLDDRWTTVLDGLPVVRPEVVILHLAATEHPRRVGRALDNAWNLRLLSGRSLITLLADYGMRGRNGTAVLRELMEARGADYTPPASNLESRVRSILEDAGIRMRLQVDSGCDDWTGRVDLRDVDLPLLVEVQSERYHSALLDVDADATRRERLEADGFVVVEVTDTEVWRDPSSIVAKVRLGRREARRRAAA